MARAAQACFLLRVLAEHNLVGYYCTALCSTLICWRCIKVLTHAACLLPAVLLHPDWHSIKYHTPTLSRAGWRRDWMSPLVRSCAACASGALVC